MIPETKFKEGYDSRNEVFMSKRLLKGSKIMVTENLTATRYELLKKCLVKLGKGNVMSGLSMAELPLKLMVLMLSLTVHRSLTIYNFPFISHACTYLCSSFSDQAIYYLQVC